MTEKEIISFLDLYNYKFEIKSNEIIIDLGYKLLVSISIKENGTILIKDCLKGWNPVSGLIDLTIKKAILFNTIGLFLVFILSELSKIPAYFYEYDYTYMLIILIAINFMWLFWYIVRFEAFKIKLEIWLKK